MIKTSHYFALACLAAVLVTSCTTTKSMQTAKQEEGKKNNAVTQSKTKEENKPIEESKPIEVKETKTEKNTVVETKTEKVATVETTALAIDNKDVFVNTPPASVLAAFKKSYPVAREVIWTKKKLATGKKNKSGRDYKANFFLDENKNSVTYSYKGEVLETRMQILPDQLPPAVYNAIKTKYPDVYVVSATTVKNISTKSSYTAIIRTETSAEREVILNEDGTFVQ